MRYKMILRSVSDYFKMKTPTTTMLVALLNLFGEIGGYVLNVGDCVVYYEEPCTAAGITFLLFSINSNKHQLTVLDAFKPELPKGFNHGTPTKILVHGYGGLPMDFTIRNVTEAYIKLGYNVILVDWGDLGAVPCYPAAFLNTWHVGQCIAVLSVGLAKLGLAPETVHIIGFSLGSHIASFASNHLNKVMKTRYYRITGLDPALPFFATLHNDWKLDKSDAPFVDVIHTSAGSFGKIEAIGHVDFYVNGGKDQPACVQASYQSLCSHLIVGLYFAKTVMGENYYGFECPSIIHYNLGLCDSKNSSTTALMGEHVNLRSKGIYFVDIPLYKLYQLN